MTQSVIYLPLRFLCKTMGKHLYLITNVTPNEQFGPCYEMLKFRLLCTKYSQNARDKAIEPRHVAILQV